MILPPATQSVQERNLLERAKHLRSHLETATRQYRSRRQVWLDYYFGRQWDPVKKQRVKMRGQDAVRVNRIRPTVRLMWGLLTTAPLDIALRGVTPESNELADVFQAVLKVNETQNNTELQEAMVSFQGVVAGEGWTYIGTYVRDDDPRQDIVQERWVDCREILCDLGTRSPDASDANFLFWSHAVNKIDLAATFKNKASQIFADAGTELDPLVEGYGGYGSYSATTNPYNNTTAYRWDGYSDQQPLPSPDDYDPVIVHEFWERRSAKVYAVQQPGMNTPDTYEESDPALAAALLTCSRYWVTHQKDVYCTLYTDNAVLATFKSPYKHGKIPFVRFVFELDDRYLPVGMVDDLTDIQDGINQFRTRLAYELSTRWWFVDPTKAAAKAGMSLDELQDQLEGDDGGVVFVDPSAVKEVNNLQLVTSLGSMVEESKAEIQFTSGINQEQMGYPSGKQSGKAMQIAIGQSQTIQRPVEVNWIAYKTAKAELRISLIQQYHDSEFIVEHVDPAGEPVYFKVNEQGFDAAGNPVVLTDISKGRYKVAIDTVPASAANKDKAVAMFNELAINEPDPIMRDVYKRIALEIGGLPYKRKFLTMVDEAQQQAQQARQAAQAGAQPPAQAQPPQEAVGQQIRG